MVVVGGESCSSDLNDLWALDLENKKWLKPEIQGQESFSPKRFHTASAIQKTKVITFGGCHSEYIHMNDLNIFDMGAFLNDPDGGHVVCTKVAVDANIPSTRWGHAAAVMGDTRLFILGGRNDKDINDMHCFDIEKMKWQQIELGHPIPRPRRRHSCIFISNCLVMFGGFDSEFFDDLNVMDLKKNSRGIENTPIEASTIDSDFLSLLNNPIDYDLTFKIEYVSECNDSNQMRLCPLSVETKNILANKSLLLFRSVDKEMPPAKRYPNIQPAPTPTAKSHLTQI